jgi:hypothetical protein
MPLGVTVNEVCRPQYERLGQRLEPNGYVTAPCVTTGKDEVAAMR